MTESAFGVELGKGLFGRPAKKAAEAAVHLNFKPIKPSTKPVGPGSLRRVMDPSAHETQLAAERRSRGGTIGKRSRQDINAAVIGGSAVGTAHLGRRAGQRTKTVRTERAAARHHAGMARGVHAGYPPTMAEPIHLAMHVYAADGAATAARRAAVSRNRYAAGATGLAAVGGAALGHRRRVGKSAFGVDSVHVPAAVGKLKPVPPASAGKVAPTRRLDAAITATRGTTS